MGPVLETERLILTPPSREDFEDWAAMWREPEVVRHFGGVPFSREETWGRLLRNVALWSVVGYGSWTARAREDGRLVGVVGFLHYKRETSPGMGEDAEVGWALHPAFHGEGYAGEALRAALAWGDRRLPTGRQVALISVENTPSVRLAERHGFRFWTAGEYKGAPVVLYERLRPA